MGKTMIRKRMREEIFNKMKGNNVKYSTLKIYDENEYLNPNGYLQDLEYIFYNRVNHFEVETSPTRSHYGAKYCQFNGSSGELPCQCTNSSACKMCLRKNTSFAPKSVEEFFFVLYRLASFNNDPFCNMSWTNLEKDLKRFEALFNYDESEIVELDFQFITKTDKIYMYTFEGKTYVFNLSY